MMSTPTFTGLEQPPVRSSSSMAGNCASDETTMSGIASADSSASGRNFPVLTSAVLIPKSRAPRTSASTSSVTSQVSSGSASSASRAAAKYDGLGLPSTVASAAGRVLEPGDERAGVEHRAEARLPPLVLVQAVERRAHLDLRERTCEVHVAEHLVRLDGLVAPADEHRLGVVADELEAVEVGDDRRHHEREHALARELAGSGAGCRLQLVVLERESHLAQLLRERDRGRVELLVTNRSAWPARRSSATASVAPGIGSPETWSTPSMSSRMHAMERESMSRRLDGGDQ